ncbi:lytic transglycosylase domain-containing protein [Microbacterium pumilum]|uniref:16S rRNA pseudouridylate synthase n=1 Tax=Microbacterium pumilum TaxID=344165 RepID=A0ABN2T1G6_9MICO
MRSKTSSPSVRRTRRMVERRARRRPAVIVAGLAVGLITAVGFAGVAPVSYAQADGVSASFALASYTTTAQPDAAVAKTETDTASSSAREAVADADAAVAAARTVAADIKASGLDVGVADTTIDTVALEETADRLELGIDHMPEPLLPWVTDQVTTLVSSVNKRVAGLRGGLDAAVALKAQQEAEAKAQQEAEAAAAAEREAAEREAAEAQPAAPVAAAMPTAAIPAGGGGGDNSPAGAQASAYAMFPGYGWGDDQFGCIVALWNRESGWNYQAYNSSSGAFGIPQALPGSKMASAGADWQSNAATQVAWGLGYVAGRYGSPCGAWSHSESYGWY